MPAVRKGPAALGHWLLPDPLGCPATVGQTAANAYVDRRAAALSEILQVAPANALATGAEPRGGYLGQPLEVAGSHPQPL